MRDFVDTVDSTDQNEKKKGQNVKDPKHDKAVFTWFEKGRPPGTRISDPVLKRHYHSEIVNNILCSGICVTQFVKKTNLKDVFYLRVTSWD